MMADSNRVPMTIRDFFFEDPFFKATWDDFDRVREAMFQESRDMWKRFDEDFRQMACMSHNIMLEQQQEQKEEEKSVEKNADSSLARWENGWMFPRRWMLPNLKGDLADLDLFQGQDSEVIRVKEEEERLEVSLDTAAYRPDELRVQVVDGMICVEGKHEEKAEDGSRMVSRQFLRRYRLPQGTKPEDVTSNLSSDGVLVVTAEKNPAIENKTDQK
jgi:HSP20 family molecular chaperone IbpA